MASKKRQWAASADTQREKARDALDHELRETRAKHSREIDKLESSLLDTKERLERAIAETEVAREVANAEKATLESALVELKRQVVKEKSFLQEARETALKVRGAGVSQPDEDLRRELTLVISDLQDERKHVAKLESQLKEANNGAVISFTEQTTGIRQEDEASAVSQIAQLQAKLEHTTRENESLVKEAARVVASENELRRIDGGGASAAPPDDIEVDTLRKALEDTEIRMAELERAKDLSVQVRQTKRLHAPTCSNSFCTCRTSRNDLSRRGFQNDAMFRLNFTSSATNSSTKQRHSCSINTLHILHSGRGFGCHTTGCQRCGGCIG